MNPDIEVTCWITGETVKIDFQMTYHEMFKAYQTTYQKYINLIDSIDRILFAEEDFDEES